MVTDFIPNSIREIGAVRKPYQCGEIEGWLRGRGIFGYKRIKGFWVGWFGNDYEIMDCV